MSKVLSLRKPVAPGGTIGILGGGQLGRMLALAAAELGLKVHIYSDEKHAPAFDVAAGHTAAAYDDEGALEAFAKGCDVVTFEFENVPASTVAALSRLKPIAPCARALEIAQDRFFEKDFVTKLGFKTTPFQGVDTRDDLQRALAIIGYPAVLKSRQLGYDGKSQAKIISKDDVSGAFESLNGAPAILEGWVDFAFEVSVIAARGHDGKFAAYDPPENFHEHHILKRSTVPSRLTHAQCVEAQTITQRIAEALDYVGVLAIEFFVGRDGGLLINEMAPRVHNSGHWTMDACLVSQFEQHIRAVAGWPLGDAARHSNAVMENLIGDEAAAWRSLAAGNGALHLYGKSEIRPGRKMGHITRLSPLATIPSSA
jgi:5-(carboxyamino)imidazole ribonucleotide synthase